MYLHTYIPRELWTDYSVQLHVLYIDCSQWHWQQSPCEVSIILRSSQKTVLASYSIAFLHYLWQRSHGQGLMCLTAALVKEWMHSGIRQSSQYTVKCGAAPHTWRKTSDRELELNHTNVTNCKNVIDNNEAANKWYTAVYRKWREHWKLPVYNGTDVAFQKALKFVHNYEEWYFLQTCVLLVQ